MEIGYLMPPMGMNLFIAIYRFDRPSWKSSRGAAVRGYPAGRGADHYLLAGTVAGADQALKNHKMRINYMFV